MLMDGSEKRSNTKLVATSLPVGFALFEEVGVSENADALFRRASEMSGRSDVAVRRGQDVGLSYLTGGKQTKAPAAYYCVVIPVNDTKSHSRPSQGWLFEVNPDTRESLISGVTDFLNGKPPTAEVDRMLGFVQGVCICKSWDFPLEVYSAVIEYQRKGGGLLSAHES